MISVGNGRYLKRVGEQWALQRICGHKYNAIDSSANGDDVYDTQYETLKTFDSYDDALNYSYRLGKYAADDDEMAWERRQIYGSE